MRSRTQDRRRPSDVPPLRVLRDALWGVGIKMPLAVLRVASEDEKAALAEIVVQRRTVRKPR